MDQPTGGEGMSKVKEYAEFFFWRIFKSVQNDLEKQFDEGNIAAFLIKILHNQSLIYSELIEIKKLLTNNNSSKGR